jgi:phospholipid/cholesterol/gamma-HCH transport system substrate-binding protein
MSAAAKVGVFAVIALIIAGVLIMRIEDLGFGRDQTSPVDVIFDSAAGLNKGDRVRVAGVDVGDVRDIKLTSDGRAIATLYVNDDVVLREGASATIASLGLLGERYVELDPGPPDAPPLSRQDQIVLFGRRPATIDEVTDQVSDIAVDIKAITESLRRAIGGVEGEQRVLDIVENVRSITDRVRLVLDMNEANINATMANFRQITDDLRVEIPRIAQSIDQVAQSLGGTVGENREDIRAIVANLRGLSAELRVTADNVGAITGQVRTGEGTIGRLLYDDEAHTRLTGALGAVEGGVTELRDLLGRVGRMELNVGIRSEYIAGGTPPVEEFEGRSRSAVSLNLVPNPDRNRFYRVELVDDPRGRRQETITRTTTIGPTGEAVTETSLETEFDRGFLITALAGWQYERLGVRVGLIQSSGGLGADYLLNPRTTITGEAFDFGGRQDPSPQLRFRGTYLWQRERPDRPALFFTTGFDNVLNDPAVTFGGGVRWTDDDLKYLLGNIPLGR